MRLHKPLHIFLRRFEKHQGEVGGEHDEGEFGDGFVPIGQAIGVRADGGYRGYLAFDPAEIPEDSEEELAGAMKVLKGILEG